MKKNPEATQPPTTAASDEPPATATRQGVLLRVSAQPRADRPGIQGLRHGALRVRLSAPPEKGRANQELISQLSAFFHVRKSDIHIVSGAASRKKKALLTGIALADIQQRLDTLPREDT
jgi:uncharacterized protein